MENPANTPVETQPSVSSPLIPEPIETPPHKTKSFPLVPILTGIIIFLIILISLLYRQSKNTTPPVPKVVVEPTIAPTPTPIRKPSLLSTSNAFTSFSQEKASFSAEMNAFSFQEGLYTPPVLELELGITD